jgi:hypothetical protein
VRSDLFKVENVENSQTLTDHFGELDASRLACYALANVQLAQGGAPMSALLAYLPRTSGVTNTEEHAPRNLA